MIPVKGLMRNLRIHSQQKFCFLLSYSENHINNHVCLFAQPAKSVGLKISALSHNLLRLACMFPFYFLGSDMSFISIVLVSVCPLIQVPK